MKRLYFISTLVFSCFTHAAGTIDYLKIDNDVVLFSTSESKTEASPACMIADNSELWSASLRSEVGRAIYSMLSIAIAKDLSVEVESAGDCADLTEFERASGMNVAFAAETDTSVSSGAKSIGVYQADGVTRVGTFLSRDTSINTVYYADGEAGVQPKSYRTDLATAVHLYYSAANCVGNVYSTSSSNLVGDGTNASIYKKASSSKSLYTYRSRWLSGRDECTDLTSTVSAYILTPYNNGECGEGLCVLKED